MTNQQSQFRGTSLSEQDFIDKKILYSHDKLNGIYHWDTGIAIGTYLDGLKIGKIIGAHCQVCRKVVVPPRVVCEWCFHPMEKYVTLEDTGIVNTFSLCYVTWDVQRIQKPEIPAVIDIDGASPLHGIMHKLGEVNPEDVQIGMHVKAIWKPPLERIGAITDILYFKPI